MELRGWQAAALAEFERAHRRGVVSAVTGAGKTVFALSCAARLQPSTVLVVVPTVALLDQWWEESASYFGLALGEVHVITGRRRMRSGTINLAVLNTAAKLQDEGRTVPSFLIVDECHKAASEKFRSALAVPKTASLGLSATPERPYDDGFEEVIVPALGPLLYSYTYAEALKDKVIVPFFLRNLVFEMEEDRQEEYAKLTRSIGRSVTKNGLDAPETVRLFLRRARVMNLSLRRVRLALKLVAQHRGQRILIFHEDIRACDLIQSVLGENGVSSGVYHSQMSLRRRAEALRAFREGELEVLVTCRALDEGFNVPEAEVGIIAASTATRRQRIQRLGRILRPSPGKDGAVVYTLVCTDPEVQRLKEEEQDLMDVAEIEWLVE